MAFAVYSQAAHGHDLDAAARQLASQNAVLQQQIDDDQQQIAQAQNPAWLQQQARKIGYVMPGEKVYYLVTPGATPLPAHGGVVAPLPTYAPPSSSPTPTAAPSAPPTPVVYVVPTPH